MDKRFNIGEHIRYMSSGVCVIDEIVHMDLFGDGMAKDFYVLVSAVDNKSKVFVPVDNETLTSKMLPVIKKQEIITLMEEVKQSETEWIEDKKRRGDYFKNTVKNCDRQENLLLIKCISDRRTELKSISKNLSSSDENILNQAENIIKKEFYYVLGIDPNDVIDYIFNKI